MKYLCPTFIAAMLLCCWQEGLSQGFVNLDFESAQIIPDTTSPYYPYGIAVTNALPGWSAWGSTQGDITYNDPALGSSWINLWATNGEQISGNYSVLLQEGLGSGAYISQTGLVPAFAVTLLFEAQSLSGASPSSLVISLGGQDLNYFAISTGSNYTLYGADISIFANQSEQLVFSALTGNNNNWNIDNIQFSSTPVPEPSELALAVLGTALLAFRYWRKSPA